MDASHSLPSGTVETLCYGPSLGYFVARFTAYPDGGGSWEDDDGESWFAPTDVTHWCEITPVQASDNGSERV